MHFHLSNIVLCNNICSYCIFSNNIINFTSFIHLSFHPQNAIDLFHNIFSPSGTQPEHRKLAHEL